MSQHDFNIANQGFPSFRSDLNTALAALASNSSGASAPSSTYANQFWYDETDNILKMRDEANANWISLGTLDQVAKTFSVASATTIAGLNASVAELNILDGVTATAAELNQLANNTFTADITVPDKIIHTGDTDTAIRFPAADTVTVETGGTERVRINASGNVGIGTSSPSQRLSVQGDGAISRLIGSGGDFQGLEIQCANASGSVTKNVFIDAVNESGVAVSSQTSAILPDGGSFWSWSTQPAGTRTDRRVERFRIGADGQIGIGGANYGTAGQVLTSGGSGAAPSWAAPPDAGIGVGQTWQSVSRTAGTTYQNTTGKPIMVVGWSAFVSGDLFLLAGEVSPPTLVVSTSGANYSLIKCVQAVIPVGAYYKFDGSFIEFRELR